MSSLADLPEIVGFFSYAREDDEAFKGRLSGLREAIQHELAAQLGRSKVTFRLWQDKEAIAPGKLWEEEIKAAVGQSVFFIPIVTPRLVKSKYCKFEFDAFLARERMLGRADLVFPILYVPVPALASEAQWRNDPVLSAIGRRQYVDWQTFRHADAPTPAMREEIARFCNQVVAALNHSWLTPEEQTQQALARARAEEEQRRQEADTKRHAELEARRQKEEEEQRRREAEQHRVAAAEAKRRAEEETQRQRGAEVKRKAEAERRNYKASVRSSDGQILSVMVQADNASSAAAMLEAQYGKGCVVGGPPTVQDNPPRPATPPNAKRQAVQSPGIVAYIFIAIFVILGLYKAITVISSPHVTDIPRDNSIFNSSH